jgi:hypothetical protein
MTMAIDENNPKHKRWSKAYDDLVRTTKVLNAHLHLPPNNPERQTAAGAHGMALAAYNDASKDLD